MKNPDHQDQWNHNENFIKWLNSNNSSFFDWLITITFYTALHKIDYCLHIKGFDDQDIDRHTKRNKLVINNLPKIAVEYVSLYTMSRVVRYNQDNMNLVSKTKSKKYLNMWYNEIKPYKP